MCLVLVSWRRWSFTSRVSGTSSDRKSTRLNSSHSQISYAVFCLKKKTDTHTTPLSFMTGWQVFVPAATFHEHANMSTGPPGLRLFTAACVHELWSSTRPAQDSSY